MPLSRKQLPEGADPVAFSETILTGFPMNIRKTTGNDSDPHIRSVFQRHVTRLSVGSIPECVLLYPVHLIGAIYRRILYRKTKQAFAQRQISFA